MRGLLPPPAVARAAAAAAVSLAVALGPVNPAAALVIDHQPDTDVNGPRVFAYVCSACHLGGYNQVRPEKTLQEDVLRANGMLAADMIEYQVLNGKNRMPAFDGRLTDDEIIDVSYYVVQQAQDGWNKKPTYVNYPSKYVSDSLQKAYGGN